MVDVGEAVAPTAVVAFGDAVVAMLPTKEDESSPASDEPDEPGVHHQFVSSVSLSRGILAMELRD